MAQKRRPPVRDEYTSESSTGQGVDPYRGDDAYMDGNGSTGPASDSKWGTGGKSGGTPYNGKVDFDEDVHRTTPISAVQAPNRPK